MTAQRILIIVPHPDDEVLLTAGLIRNAVLQNRDISVAIATNGDYLCPDFSKGITRIRESLNVLLSLGVSKENIYFLGYPDTGFEPEVSFLSRLLKAPENKIIASSCSEQTYALPEHADYCFARSNSHALYTRAAFCADLRALLADIRPQLVVSTAAQDLHGDHSALFELVRAEIEKITQARPTLWVGMVHSPDGDLSWPRFTADTSTFEAPTSLWGELDWQQRIRMALPSEMLAERTDNCKKYELISMYKTALNPNEPEVCEYLLAFAKNEEVFWEITI